VSIRSPAQLQLARNCPKVNVVNFPGLADRYRADFPILSQDVNGHPLTYLDNAASTQHPTAVIEELARYYREDHANVHRGLHSLSNRATALYEKARVTVARYLNARKAESIVFTRGTTEGINLVAESWASRNLRPGDVVVLTEMEHHANLIPWQIVTRKTGAILRFLPIRGDTGAIEWTELEELCRRGNVRLIALTHISNSLGCINPIKQVCQMGKRYGAVTLIDAAQSAGHAPLDVEAIGCDFLVFSSHKCCGPTGIGVLYGREELLDSMEPYQTGGEMIVSVDWKEARWKPAPHRFEAGTPHIAGAIGLAKALEYLESIGRDKIEESDHFFGIAAAERLRELPKMRLLGPVADRAGIVSFQLGTIHAHDLVAFADQYGVALRGGHHCNQPLMRKLGLMASARASFYFYNTEAEIDRFISVLRDAAKYFGD
jgi:cysteine desulfurase / selenocysteine lyase